MHILLKVQKRFLQTCYKAQLRNCSQLYGASYRLCLDTADLFYSAKLYTLCLKKGSPFYILNNSAKMNRFQYF